MSHFLEPKVKKISEFSYSSVDAMGSGDASLLGRPVASRCD